MRLKRWRSTKYAATVAYLVLIVLGVTGMIPSRLSTSLVVILLGVVLFIQSYEDARRGRTASMLFSAIGGIICISALTLILILTEFS
ncbi:MULTISPECIES: hypothetical protein [Paenibacillus]|uniref:DUF3953 domain-containing protein n=1 Tax=Paenibacillus glycanilyticus TaxID=126569 RepID=A0ABQ6NUR3_9BACL|nr:MULTISPECIES: hypothetical protein [Paenibacillus]ACS99011.1 hypothetical protein Pjdr2_0331 [Paenibacillus sp. JDR-2]MCK9860436.1 hypothetical protein [Paenibacillus sp. ATY16]GMK48831.1 hypothetical protein PghCCS26_59610 [Paenibacillus glycanilyticus]